MIVDFSEGLACVLDNGKFGFIDKQGAFVIPPRFSTPGTFRKGLAAVREDGELLYPRRYGAYQKFTGLGGQFIYIDKFGNRKIELPKAFGLQVLFTMTGFQFLMRTMNVRYIDRFGSTVLRST